MTYMSRADQIKRIRFSSSILFHLKELKSACEPAYKILIKSGADSLREYLTFGDHLDDGRTYYLPVEISLFSISIVFHFSLDQDRIVIHDISDGYDGDDPDPGRPISLLPHQGESINILDTYGLDKAIHMPEPKEKSSINVWCVALIKHVLNHLLNSEKIGVRSASTPDNTVWFSNLYISVDTLEKVKSVQKSNDKFERNKPHINVVTIGHVDILIAALIFCQAEKFGGSASAYDQIDNAPEEKARGITIASEHLECEYVNRHYAHVNCPIHADYVKDMVTETAQMDGAIMVCSGADGWTPQSREHVLLDRQVGGVPYIVIYLKKADMADDTELVDMGFLEHLDSYEFPGDGTPGITGSAVKVMEGNTSEIGYLSTNCLVDALDTYTRMPEGSIDQLFLAPVEDVLSISGRGTVVIGRVLSKDEGGRHTPFFNNYSPQLYFRTMDVTSVDELPVLRNIIIVRNMVYSTAMVVDPFVVRDGCQIVDTSITARHDENDELRLHTENLPSGRFYSPDNTVCKCSTNFFIDHSSRFSTTTSYVFCDPTGLC